MNCLSDFYQRIEEFYKRRFEEIFNLFKIRVVFLDVVDFQLKMLRIVHYTFTFLYTQVLYPLK